MKAFTPDGRIKHIKLKFENGFLASCSTEKIHATGNLMFDSCVYDSEGYYRADLSERKEITQAEWLKALEGINPAYVLETFIH